MKTLREYIDMVSENSDPILDFITTHQDVGLSGGNCGVLAIALDKLFDMDEFLFVENEAEPERLYHVAASKNGKIYDVDGITSENSVLQRGFDDDYPEYEPTIQSVPASQNEYRYILRATEPTISVDDLTG